MNANDVKSARNKEAEKELRAECREREKIEKEFARKENALAETTALLVLRKKADAIWGTAEEEDRKEVYEKAREKHPERWSKPVREWLYSEREWMNPRKKTDDKGSQTA